MFAPETAFDSSPVKGDNLLDNLESRPVPLHTFGVLSHIFEKNLHVESTHGKGDGGNSVLKEVHRQAFGGFDIAGTDPQFLVEDRRVVKEECSFPRGSSFWSMSRMSSSHNKDAYSSGLQ